MQVVDDFSSKLGLPNTLETPESIDANHMQMARCTDRSDESYRSIVGVILQSLKNTDVTTNLPVRSAAQTQREAQSMAAHGIQAR